MSQLVIPTYDFASASALSKSEYPLGAKVGIHFDFFLRLLKGGVVNLVGGSPTASHFLLTA